MELVNLGSLFYPAHKSECGCFVLYRFIFKPYLAFIDEEIEKKRIFDENAHAAEHIISNAGKEAAAILEKAKNEARAIVADSEGLAKKEYSLILSDARRRLNRLRLRPQRISKMNEFSFMKNSETRFFLLRSMRMKNSSEKKRQISDFIKQVMKDTSL